MAPGYAYFRNLYIHPEGKLRNLFLAFRGARIFDPIFLSGCTLPAALLMVDDLLRFGFPEFTPAFIRGVKKELTLKYIKQANEDFLWGELPG